MSADRHACVQILIVESAAAPGGATAEQLAADGYRVKLARTAEHARVLARGEPPALALIGDLGAPRGALALLEEMRAGAGGGGPWKEDLPVIVRSGRAGEPDLLRAFDAGADDVIAPGAGYLELRARMRAVLRRSTRTPAPAPTLRVGPLAIDRSARSVSLGGQPVELRRLEFELLVHMAGRPEHVFGRDELLRAVWGYRCLGSTRTLDSHASRLRRKLRGGGERRWVISVRGVGYRLL